MRLFLVSEGPTDVGHDSATADERIGALRVLVRRTIEARWDRTVADGEIETAYLPRAHLQSSEVSGYPRKVRLAIVEAAARGCTHVAVVVDRDRTEGTTRLRRLEEGIELAERSGDPLAYKTAIGVAIETIEAWLLADEVALNRVLAPTPPVATQSSPENLGGAPGTATHPKVVFRGIVRRSTREAVDEYGEVAAFIRLDVLRERCPDGFGRFAAELDRIVS